MDPHVQSNTMPSDYGLEIILGRHEGLEEVCEHIATLDVVPEGQQTGFRAKP